MATLGTLAATASMVTLIRSGSAGPSAGTGSMTADEVVAKLMVWTAVALSGWLGLGSLLALGATLPGAVGAGCQALARLLTPRLLRQGVAVALGTAVATVSLPAGPAVGVGTGRNGGVTQLVEEAEVTPVSTTRHTATAPIPVFVPTRGAGAASAPARDGVALPAWDRDSVQARGATRPIGAPGPGWRPTSPPPRVGPHQTRLLAPPPRAATALDTGVTVRRGDSLWSIAARHLGDGASDAEIALAWPRWYAANRDVIGSDPDHLVPGQQLCPPSAGEDQ